MADDYHDLDVRIRELTEIVIRHISEADQRWRYYDKQMDEQQERSARAPVLLFAGISALSGLVYGAINLILHFWVN